MDLPELTGLDQQVEAEESVETQGDGSLFTKPPFWIAVVGWTLVDLLLVVVVLLAS
jgi:hypothetical protein